MRSLAAILAVLGLIAAGAGCGGSDSPDPVGLSDPGSSTDGADDLGGSGGDEDAADADGLGGPGATKGSGDKEPGDGAEPNTGGARAGSGGAEDGGSDAGGAPSGSGGQGGSGKPGRSGGSPADPGASEQEVTKAARELESAKQTVRSLIAGLNRRDPDVCDLFTQRYLEETTRLKGGAAREKCRADARLATGRSELGPFGPSEVNDGHDRAVVRFNLKVDGKLTSQTVHEVKQAGSWRIDRRS